MRLTGAALLTAEMRQAARPLNAKPNAYPNSASRGFVRAADASAAATTAARRSGSAVADCAQEITAAWARYAEEVMRHTSEASRALLRARTFNEMLEVQAKLLRDNMQAFLDQSVRVAEFGEPYGGDPPLGGIEGGEYGAAAKLAVAR